MLLFSKSKQKKDDRAGCSHNVWIFTCVFVALSKCRVCFCSFFCTFDTTTQPLNTGWWLQLPIRVEYKLSISRSNSCMWQVPVRQPNASQLSGDPALSAVYRRPLPLQSNSDSCCHQCLMCFYFLISNVISAPVPSRGLQTFRMSRLHCATGVHLFPEVFQ